jgi:YidC/Oxa1 family membrane protein insertase
LELFLSKVTTPVFGWIVQLMGWIIDGVYIVLDTIRIPNVGLAIILYTVIVYMFMYPLTKKQQKLSKMMSYMQPEISAIQKKYQGKRDQQSMYKMQEETNAVYQKYGTSPYGTCLPLLIQLPLLYALYQVIYHIPGYIERVAEIFSGLATKIMLIPGGTSAFMGFINDHQVRVAIGGALTKTNIIDALSNMTANQWAALQNVPQFSDIAAQISDTATRSASVNSFFGLNITESPIETIQNAMSSGMWWMIILAVLVPVLAWFTQWITLKLSPQQSAQSADQPGAGSMKVMNNFMPLFSAFLCFSFSLGIGIYWIAGAVIRGVQMVYINRKMMKINVEELIRKNQEKAAKKAQSGQKDRVEGSRINEQAHVKTRRVEAKGKYTNDITKGIDDYYERSKNADPNSILAKANLVRKFDETHSNDKRSNKKK